MLLFYTDTEVVNLNGVKNWLFYKKECSQQQKEQQELRIQDNNSVGSHTCTLSILTSYIYSFFVLLLHCTLLAELNEYLGRWALSWYERRLQF